MSSCSKQPEWLVSPDDKCSFCGHREPEGLWQGSEGSILCCRYCAENVLPTFMADSIGDGAMADRFDYVMACRILRRLEGIFWKGVAARLSRNK